MASCLQSVGRYERDSMRLDTEDTIYYIQKYKILIYDKLENQHSLKYYKHVLQLW